MQLIDHTHRIQVQEMQLHCIKAITLDTENFQAYGDTAEVYAQLRRCEWQVIIMSPEWLVTPEFDRLIRNDHFCHNLALYVVDEAHVVATWGASFHRTSVLFVSKSLWKPLSSP